jgi:predicted phosphoribosyltransferase
MLFENRAEAGKELAAKLTKYQNQAVVYALPRGGVVVGAEIAKKLSVPLDLIIARKIGHPYNSEYAIGAVTETGDPIWNEEELKSISGQWQKSQIELARTEAKRRRIKYLGDKPAFSVKNKTAIIVDDGIATGLTMIAAIAELRKRQPKKVIVAVPVAPKDTTEKIANLCDEVVVLHNPSSGFWAIGNYYQDFNQVEDQEVKALMDKITSPKAKSGAKR